VKRIEHAMVDERAAVVQVPGELDLSSADALREALDAAEAEQPDVVRVSAPDADLLDSSALGVMLAAAQRLAERGARLELVCTSPSVRRVLDLTLIGHTVHVIP
jgi:anti-sigma B factor antagonist